MSRNRKQKASEKIIGSESNVRHFGLLHGVAGAQSSTIFVLYIHTISYINYHQFIHLRNLHSICFPSGFARQITSAFALAASPWQKAQSAARTRAMGLFGSSMAWRRGYEAMEAMEAMAIDLWKTDKHADLRMRIMKNGDVYPFIDHLPMNNGDFHGYVRLGRRRVSMGFNQPR